MVKAGALVPSVPVMARELSLVDGDRRDDKAAIAAHRPENAADL